MAIFDWTRRAAKPFVYRAATSIGKTRLGRQMIRTAALLPPALKFASLADVMRIFADCCEGVPLVETNLGIARSLSVRVPSAKTYLAFGRPRDFRPERGTLRLLRALAPMSKAFVDVGAHEGLHTFFVADILGDDPDRAIHVFEPDPILFARLSDNLDRNGVRAKKNRVAASSTSGMTTFYRNMTDDASGSLNEAFVATSETRAIDVVSIPLADYLIAEQLNGVCMKMDVEGWGSAAWRGLSAAAERVDWLILEITAPEWEEELPRRVIEETGWFAYYIRDDELCPWSGGSYDYLPSCLNWLFCRLAPAALARLVESAGVRMRDDVAAGGKMQCSKHIQRAAPAP